MAYSNKYYGDEPPAPGTGGTPFDGTFTLDGANVDIALALSDLANTWLSFTDGATPANVIEFLQDTTNPLAETTVTNGLETLRVSDFPFEHRVTVEGATSMTPTFSIRDLEANTFLSFQDVTTTNLITLAHDTSVPSLTTMVTDGPGFVSQELTIPNVFNYRYRVDSSNGVGQTANLQLLADEFRATVSPGGGTNSVFLLDNLGAYDFLTFTNVTLPTNVITMAQDTDIPSLTTTVTNGTRSAELVQDDVGFQLTSGGALTNASYSFALRDSTSSSFLVFTDVAAPANEITLSRDTGTPSLITTATNGVQSFDVTQEAQIYNVNGTNGASSILQSMNILIPSLLTTVTDGTGTITTTANAAAASLSTTVTSGTNIVTTSQDAFGGLTTTVLSASGSSTLALQDRGLILPYGGTVASAATITPYGNVFHVSGTTNIDTITATLAGTCIVMIFDGILTVLETGNIKLSAAFVSAADSTLSLVHDGTTWYETARSIN